jgi:hypothetical protein
MFAHSGQLKYHPLIEIFTGSTSIHSGESYKLREQPMQFWQPPETLTLRTFSAPHTALIDGDIHLTDAEFVPLLSLELPSLEGVDFQALGRLMSDYPEELCSFRDFLMNTIEGLRIASVASGDFDASCKRADRELREQLRKVRSDFRKSQLTGAFSLTGCAVASWALALYCIIEGKGDILKLVGPGGAVVSLSAALSAYLQKRLELKDNPAYFLWLIERQTR